MFTKIKTIFSSPVWVFIESFVMIGLFFNILEELLWMINQPNDLANFIGFVCIPLSGYLFARYIFSRVIPNMKPLINNIKPKEYNDEV